MGECENAEKDVCLMYGNISTKFLCAPLGLKKIDSEIQSIRV